MESYSLKYIGLGDWLPGVPASDHTAEYTQERVEQLLDSGLYELAGGTISDDGSTPRKRKNAPVADAAAGKD